MAAKADYLEGVFVFTCSSPKRAYVGKSKGVGVAKRSGKSKLKKGTFHNKEMQKDFDNYPENFDLSGNITLLEGNEYGCKNLGELVDEIRWNYVDEGYLLWNDIHVVEGKEKVTEVDVLRDRIDGDDYNVVESIVELLVGGELTSQQVRKLFLSQGIEL